MSSDSSISSSQADAEVVSKDLTSDNSLENAIAEDESKAEGESALAVEPVMVGGAFLNCQVTSSLQCRLDTKDEENIEIPTDFKVSFYGDDIPLSFQELAEGNYRWSIDMADLNIFKLKLVLATGRTEYTYETFLEANPIHVGDGTNQQQGCSTNIARNAMSVGNSYSRDIEISVTQNYRLKIFSLCGVARANDSFIAFRSNLDDSIVGMQFLEISRRGPRDYVLEFDQLPAGSYTLDVVAGDDIDIDDLFFNGIVFSQVAK
ncbi:hypothetical protein [Pseudobacteriovorax antillogorgiicola]|nr:hypothetical protein [Pseudobacteriovorax antillogorgiicola]